MLVSSSNEFENRYGADWDIILRISAKCGLSENELRGPSEFKKDKHVEFTIFLPYDVIIAQKHWCSYAVEYLINGTCSALEKLSLSSRELKQQKNKIVETVCSTDSMIKEE
jgi:hypothetical protein